MDPSSPVPPFHATNLNLNTTCLGLLNIRSARNKTGYLCALLDVHSISILCLTETWLFESDIPAFSAQLTSSYSLLHVARPALDVPCPGGGVGVIYHSSLNILRTPDLPVSSAFERLSFAWHRWGLPDLCITVIYRHNHPRSTRTFLTDFAILIDALTSIYSSSFIIVGDFNFWPDQPRNHQYTPEFLDLLDCHGINNLIHSPTHISGHTLDLLLIPSNSSDDNLTAIPITVFPNNHNISDHNLITFSIPHTRPGIRSRTITFRNYKSFDAEMCSMELSRLFDPQLFYYLTPVEIYPFIHEQLSSLNNTVFPVITKRLSPHPPPPPWYDSHIRSLRRRQRCAERRWRRSRSLESWREFVACGRLYVSAFVSAKNNYYLQKALLVSSNPKSLWSTLFDLLGRTPKSSSITYPISASDFLTSFATKLELSRAKLPPPGVVSHTTCSGIFTSFQHISVLDTRRLLSKINKTFSTLDAISFPALTPCIHLLAPVLTHLINSSFLHGVFLANKQAVLFPTLKRPNLDPLVATNYRPVSHLSLVSKILEAAIYEQLSFYLLSNDLFDISQSGFIPGRSTETALLRTHSDVLSYFASKSPVLLILVDMTSAFDLVDHHVLQLDLAAVGLADSALSLLTSYLTDRSFAVRFGGETSTFAPLSSGVPQGSILGPILFNLYMTSLCPILRSYSVNFQIYADDIQIYFPLPVPYDTYINDLLSAVSAWASGRGLLINESKTEYLVLHPPRLFSPLLDSLQTIRSDVARNLGVIFDSNLTFKKHILSTARTCRLVLRSLYTIRNSIDTNSAIKLITSLIFPRLDYCNSLFVSLPRKSLNILQSVINQSCRFVLRLPPRHPTSPSLFSLKWLPIIPRIHLKLCLIIHKTILSGRSTCLSELISSPSFTGHDLRAEPTLAEPSAAHGSTWAAKSFQFTGPRIYNSIPIEIRGLRSIPSFAAKLKTHLMIKSFDPITHNLTDYAKI